MAAKILLIVLLVTWGPLAVGAAEDDKKKDEPLPEAKVSVTEHQVRIGDRTIDYTATAGTMLMKNDDDKPVALFGYTAYVADVDDRNERPLMFAYNGGPGSASIWLHMGALGPQRAVVTDVGFSPAGPFERVTNEYSILDEADLVMMDPVGTGFAKAIGKGKNEDFWGVDQDIRSVSEFIVQYVTQNGRWASPKYILGESYGGMRTGGVSYHLLTRYNMALNGVILVSPFMEMTAGFAGLGIDLPHVMFLPTFAATAWYHDALENKPADIAAFVDEVEKFAVEEYAPALLAGSNLSGADRRSVVEGLARYTGLSEEYWDRANLRIDEGQFTQQLMRERGITVGRVDSRFSGDSIDKLAESAPYDPFTTAIGPSYLAAFMDYYRSDLGVENSDNYVVSGGFFMEWDWAHKQPDLDGFELPFPNTAVDLEYALKQNPAMRVLVLQGYFDLATPSFATEYAMDHMDLSPDLRDNIQFEYFESGHMMYVHEPSLVKFKEDVARFVRDSH
jgi:carboxypeptidase C (cathepsin A)